MFKVGDRVKFRPDEMYKEVPAKYGVEDAKYLGVVDKGQIE